MAVFLTTNRRKGTVAACEVCGVEAGFLYVEGAKICAKCGEEQFGDFSNAGKMDKKFKLHDGELKGKKDKKNNRVVSDDEIFLNGKRKARSKDDSH